MHDKGKNDSDKKTPDVVSFLYPDVRIGEIPDELVPQKVEELLANLPRELRDKIDETRDPEKQAPSGGRGQRTTDSPERS